MSVAQLHDLAWIFGLFALHLAVPGPSMLYICASASRGQRRQALGFIVGTSVGTAVWAGMALLGAWQLTAEVPLFARGLKLVVGLALIGFGARALLVALAGPEPAAGSRGASPRLAVLHGILLTMASVNELVFWTAILALGAGTMSSAGHDAAFALALVAGVVGIALALEGTLVCVATTGGIARFMGRIRRPLEFAMAIAFCVTGAALLELV